MTDHDPSDWEMPGLARWGLILGTIGLFMFLTSCTWPLTILLSMVVGLFQGLFNPESPFSLHHDWFTWVAAITTGVVLILAAFTYDWSLSLERSYDVRKPARVACLWAAGIAGIGIAYHGTVLFSHQIVGQRWSWRARSDSKNNLKQIGLALHNYHDVHRTFPPGGVVSGDGIPQHSWATMLLPYVDHEQLAQRIDYEMPWSHPTNSDLMKTEVHPYLHRSLRDYNQHPDGYGMIHYSANSHVLNVNSKTAIRDLTDGTSNTIAAGEVTSELVPWGQPMNARDPMLGLNRSPVGFGSPYRRVEYGRVLGGCSFLMADGHVRWLSDDIDPEVLRKLADPQDGQVVGEF